MGGPWLTAASLAAAAAGVVAQRWEPDRATRVLRRYFVFTSFWNYKFYYVYGFMLLVFVILAIVTVCITIVVTYFQLNNEDYRWQWTSFAASSSTPGYVRQRRSNFACPLRLRSGKCEFGGWRC